MIVKHSTVMLAANGENTLQLKLVVSFLNKMKETAEAYLFTKVKMNVLLFQLLNDSPVKDKQWSAVGLNHFKSC